uniref:C-CAP/cofactor C-like domain-containing protein n=1 Tax=Babesia bovis TaxID=5865 RepID=S6B2Y2_BABBO|nr:hypothetical protein [Babesia bovis]
MAFSNPCVMCTSQGSKQGLIDAEVIYERARKCSSTEESQVLKHEIMHRLRDYVSSNTNDPAVYKMLQNALTKLKASEYTGGSNKSFTFRSVRTTITDKECNMEQSAAPQDEATNINHCNYQPGITLQNGTLYITMVKGIDVVRDNVTLEHVSSVIEKNVERCRIVLMGRIETAYLCNVKDSIVWIGVASSSVISEWIESSRVIVSCRQLRIADSIGVKFFVNTVTPPIIERSKGITVAKNHINYPDQEHDAKISGISPWHGDGNITVTDFSWHHGAMSPSWKPCPPPAGCEAIHH